MNKRKKYEKGKKSPLISPCKRKHHYEFSFLPERYILDQNHAFKNLD
jgi:hypothetical protein